ncbi:MAG: hypothetical protein J6Y62_01040 [Clostridia bacterium]|nr:hypothetical protein [Clostridia bacterium]
MKTIYVNLWDDYHQMPHHQWNDTTTLTVEDHSDNPISDRDFFDIREILLQKCLQWRPLFSPVRFSRNMDGRTIDVIELDEGSRKKLHQFLCDHFKTAMGYEIQMLMES